MCFFFLDVEKRRKGYKTYEKTVTFFQGITSHVKMRFQEDQFYIERTLRGNMNAYGQLIQKHEKYVFTLAMRILKNREEAEEAAQDAFMKAYHSLKTFEGKSKFTTWLYTIVYNEALGRLRKSKNYTVQLDEAEDLATSPSEYLDGLKTLQLADRKELIQRGLDTIKPAESAALTLFYLEEQSIKEIEDIMGLTSSHVKILLHRGRKSLLESLQKITNTELIHLL
ncbi:RNA polymerase sigma-70 factor, ECF subfamily [Algoriphagus locisalis]|uniref:RNA polymerase sigma-70 factor, ECF subfamily n=1 Tax=Algoriphagus locisalis TaxID=305507 RepID=A0A1I6ZUJ4_9BACT|nr:RNA polymerase sigma factor [Algoriphagus locisalis]SFT66354.1 RNA polymerase sigma-70 factor, ECF subfamily [Algoriphagus locisalis]